MEIHNFNSNIIKLLTANEFNIPTYSINNLEITTVSESITLTVEAVFRKTYTRKEFEELFNKTMELYKNE